MSASEHRPSTRHTASTLARIAFAAVVASLAPACGDDDPGSAVAAACSSSCQKTSGQCGIVNLAPGCATLCDLGYNLAPACGPAYQGYVTCVGDMPIVSCNGNALTVNVTLPPCLDQLGSYLNCAVSNLLNGCVDLPLENGVCVDQKLGNRAVGCIGAPPGCSLLTGTVQSGGLGVFCCQ